MRPRNPSLLPSLLLALLATAGACNDAGKADSASTSAAGGGGAGGVGDGGGGQGGQGGQEDPLRDPYLWPFASESIWNMPIGEGAQYKAVNLEPAGHVGADIQHLLRLSDADPERTVLDSPTWGPGRCTGTMELGIALRVPDAWLVPDAGPDNPYGLTPNSNFALLLPDGETVFEGSKISRCAVAGPVYLPEWMKYPANQKKQSIRGTGLGGGGQGASGMSALGGTIRLGELTGERPLHHAIKMNPWAAKYLHWSDAVPGYRWPAVSADSYAKDSYKPEMYGRTSDPSLVMGSLLAIPPDVTEAQIGLQTEPGKRLFAVLRDYGAYFTEDAAWDTWDLIVERDVEVEFEKAYGFGMGSAAWRDELNRLMVVLAVVDNNGPQTIGGGGKPRAQMAPAFLP
jgi:hypothetical protein